MKHIRGRHAIVGILESTTGGLIATALFTRSLWTGLLSLGLGVIAVCLDRINIEDEESEVEGIDHRRDR